MTTLDLAGWERALRRAARNLRRAARRSDTLVRFALRRQLERGQPDWRGFVARGGDRWRDMAGAKGRPRVLIATSTGGFLPGTAMESLLAAALITRGASVDVLLCDAALPACQMTVAGSGTSESQLIRCGPEICGPCHDPARRMYEALGVTVHRYSDHVTPAAAAASAETAARLPAAGIATFEQDGVALGEHALAGALRFYGRGELGSSAGVEAVLRRYLEAALRTAAAIDHLLDAEAYDCVVFHHGVYVPQGIVGEVCRRRGVRVVNWNVGYRNQSFIFSHADTYHRTMISEPTERWRDLELTAAQRDALRRYLRGRWTGTDDWIWFHERPDFDVDRFAAARGLDGRPRIGLLTSVTWDARLHYASNAFPGMLEWVFATIRHFARRPDLQLVIRVHPAEISGVLPASQRVADEIAREFPVRPPNVVVVGPDDPISTYALMDTCDAAIIYNTKTGIELAAAGLPVIVAGEAWIRGKGFSLDVSDPVSYESVLAQLPLRRRLDAAQAELAARYAYHFFFCRMIPMRLIRGFSSSPYYRPAVSSWKALRPGADRGLDVICDGILRGDDFVYTAYDDGTY